ncbi:PfkB family carbohydrate kinase [Salarchaeum sp. JOR-1]|uniref:PfkB family carbohydrate kinase n=1 Tax=Salarchaeum sp. JOR-1 TaxID=2599399 RepID=UPI0011984F22|nr:PfkB family carbohydrate kinase [Salarchaeum sp. JOR-1]QDX39590.1 carbohydrate kinase family protein [Salarchaeum sp. JOR-1]
MDERTGRLADARGVLDASVTATALPDGSVDRRYTVEDRAGAVRSRESFGRRIAAGEAKSFYVDHEATDPGGQAVNDAFQFHALGDDTTLAGHLDHDIFETLPFDAYSMGAPAHVDIYEFESDAVMLTEESAGIETWRFETLERALGPRLDAALAADAVVWANWASVPHATDALRELRERDPDGGVLVLDPGDVTIIDPDTVRGFADALGALTDRYEVVVSANRGEAAFLADALDASFADDGSLARAARAALGVDAFVLHEVEHAVAATRDVLAFVPNEPTSDPVRFTGAGDRFSAGLAHARAADGSWVAALALANACAAHYAIRGETADSDTLRSFIE